MKKRYALKSILALVVTFLIILSFSSCESENPGTESPNFDYSIVYEDGEWSYIREIAEGEEYPKENCAFSVYIPKAGEDLWSLAKRLHRNPESIKESNPRLQFPLSGDERIFVYRQIK